MKKVMTISILGLFLFNSCFFKGYSLQNNETDEENNSTNFSVAENTTEKPEESISSEDKANIDKMNDLFNKIEFRCSADDLRNLLGKEESSSEIQGGNSYSFGFGEKYKIICEINYTGLYKKYKVFDDNAIPKVRKDKIESLEKISFSKSTGLSILGEGFLYVDMISGHEGTTSDTEKYLYKDPYEDKIYIVDYYYGSCVGGIEEFKKD